eukprot:CAMPEP_0118635050 /NCGR_PEP_ID=MMETSP0785-20121206/1871_1 /TAXON_ID=91992 /ORGANISM="Bolidomonas pacifica, Strain CCMP 1866" /LENGTH=284 /DNA_ID=CAMNT_0006526061 /DNA_START=459 /DNA_END=1310 /DNA_ORIENTATION=-
MEVLEQYGTPKQKRMWLKGLMDGSIRSAFCMTEPDYASSDARNVKGTTIQEEFKDGVKGYRVEGRKWWSTGGNDPRCKVLLVLCKLVLPSGTKEDGHTLIIVPRDTPGVRVVRDLDVFGHKDEPFGHCEFEFKGVWVEEDNVVGGLGMGGKIAQSRLGPGRIHHCMRAVGLGSRVYDIMIKRSIERKVFGKRMIEHGMQQRKIAEGKGRLETARLLTLAAASKMDEVGAKGARTDISLAKILVPRMMLGIIDDAIQTHGGEGVQGELAFFYGTMRCLRIADGPD